MLTVKNTNTEWWGLILQIIPLVVKGSKWNKEWSVNRYKWRGISKDTRNIAFAINSFSWTNLQQTAPVINRVGLISRPEIEQIQSIWDTDAPIKTSVSQMVKNGYIDSGFQFAKILTGK